MTVGGSAADTAINVCTELTEGIITRFRTMATSRTSVRGAA
jgi:ABC-2 type transport system permease protein